MSDANQPQAQVSPRKGYSCLWMILAVFGGSAILVFVVCGGVVYWVNSVPRGGSAARELFSYADVPIPAFPDDRGAPVPTKDDPEINRYEISLGEQGGYYETPGAGGTMWLYLPPGDHAPQSLPCVLIAASRIDVLRGAGLKRLDEDEHIPYVKAGCAVLAYELDGRNDGEMFDESVQKKEFAAFKESRAGLVNARNALEYVVQKVPEVDPERIYAAGLFYGGTHALLFATHEPRLAGVMASEAAVDVPALLGPLNLRVEESSQPGYIDFATQVSPATHCEHLKSPTFIFHVDAERKLRPLEGVELFVECLKDQGTKVELDVLKTRHPGEKKKGLAASLEWIRKEAGLR